MSIEPAWSNFFRKPLLSGARRSFSQKYANLISFVTLLGTLGWVNASDAEPVKCRVVVAHETYQADATILAGLELSVQAGWHVYWVNPGDAGMATSIEVKMPDGWICNPIIWPVPVGFQSGALRGFGYKDKVVVPIRLTPGKDFDGEVEVILNVTWLACNEDACLPGDAELVVHLKPGQSDPAAEKEKLEQVEARLPEEDRTSGFSVIESGEWVHLSLPIRQGRDYSKVLGYPETPQTIENRAVRFKIEEGEWRARARKSEFQIGPVKRLAMVIAGQGLVRPIRVFWEVR